MWIPPRVHGHSTAALALHRGGHEGRRPRAARDALSPSANALPCHCTYRGSGTAAGTESQLEQRGELQGWDKRELSPGQHRPCQQDISSQRLRAELRTCLELEGERGLRANPPALWQSPWAQGLARAIVTILWAGRSRRSCKDSDDGTSGARARYALRSDCTRALRPPQHRILCPPCSAGSAPALLHAGWFNTAVREVRATSRAWLCRQPAVQAPLQNTLLPCVLTVRRRNFFFFK